MFKAFQALFGKKEETDRTNSEGEQTIMTEITKDTNIGDILTNAPEVAPAFFNIGMHCLGCPASRNETVEQACAVHDVDTETLLAELNAILTANKTAEAE